MASTSLLHEYKFESFLSGKSCKRVDLYFHKQKIDSWCGELVSFEAPNNIQSAMVWQVVVREIYRTSSSWRT